MSDPTDRIEREIEIDATAERVWQLVSQPGWWINDGEIVDHKVERVGDLDIVHDPTHGEFRLRTERLDPSRYAAFRWIAREPDQSGNESSTLTEFWIDDREGDGVTLRVVESGFDSLDVTDEQRRQQLDENTEGWQLELAAARAFAESA
jgi:uncharacterized protein YndB with AHSA1/START domain